MKQRKPRKFNRPRATPDPLPILSVIMEKGRTQDEEKKPRRKAREAWRGRDEPRGVSMRATRRSSWMREHPIRGFFLLLALLEMRGMMMHPGIPALV